MASAVASAFLPLSFARQSHGQLLANACSPDKDLFVLLVTVQNKDRLSLWKTVQGTKVWEVDVCQHVPVRERVTALAWAPDGMRIVLAHHPPRLSVHSVQDGAELSSVVVTWSDTEMWLPRVWWLKNPQVEGPSLWRREDIVPGSALSTLQSLTILDAFQDYSKAQPETFSFGTDITSRARTETAPAAIDEWPHFEDTLHLASIAASDNTPEDDPDDGGRHTDHQYIGDEDPLVNSLIVVSTNVGWLLPYLDGAVRFPLGYIHGVPAKSHILEVSAAPGSEHDTISSLNVHTFHTGVGTNAIPQRLDMPLLQTRTLREVARVSSVARDLLWYAIRVTHSMREGWVGSGAEGSEEGAHILGRKFLKNVDDRIRAHSSKEVPHGMYDLSALLLTGRPSDGLADVLSSQQQSVSLNRWETSMSDALVKIRDYCDRRIAPACQRLLVLLQDVRGWAALPHQFAPFECDKTVIDTAIAQTRRAIEFSAVLASHAREELEGFKHFVSWLRLEMQAVVAESPPPYVYRHDPLIISAYLQRGLTESNLDAFLDPRWKPSSSMIATKWNATTMAGEGKVKVPGVSMSDVRVPKPSRTLGMVLVQAKKAVKELRDADAAGNGSIQGIENTLAKLGHSRPSDDHLDRNLEALLGDLAVNCQKIFSHAAKAATRTTKIGALNVDMADGVAAAAAVPDTDRLLLCERVRGTVPDDPHVVQFAAILGPQEKLCILRTTQDLASGGEATGELHGAVFDCAVETPEASTVEILAADFFDDESLAVVYRPTETDDLYLALADYTSATYAALPSSTTWSREHASSSLASALPSTPIPITQSRKLRMTCSADAAGPRTGGAGLFGEVEPKSVVQLAVNGRPGRRVVCVYSRDTGELETVDMEGSEEDEEGDDEVMGDESEA